MLHRAQRVFSQGRIRLGIGVLLVLAALLGCWLSTAETRYQYRNLTRWQGVFNNPNTCGQVAAGALVLAVGLLGCSLASKAKRKGLWVAVALAAAVALAVPLGFTFSRGAWLGCALGLAYLGGQGWSWFSKRLLRNGGAPVSEPAWAGADYCRSGDRRSAVGEGAGGSVEVSRGFAGRVGLVVQRNLLPLAIALALLGVTAFWLFRFTEFKPVRRAFSVGNINDSSWRMRVEAWEGALNIIAHSPWVGSEWKKPELTYYQFFQKPKVLEGAAIQLNDYFIVGMTWGIPVLACFAAWVWSAFRPRRWGVSESAGERSRPGCSSVRPRAELHGARIGQTVPGWESPMQPAGAQAATPGAGALPVPTEPASRAAQDEWLKATCRAAVVVLLVGFWFDGGLFKWALAVPFWLLLEMGRSHPLWERRSAQV
jgi:hypothetical protein